MNRIREFLLGLLVAAPCLYAQGTPAVEGAPSVEKTEQAFSHLQKDMEWWGRPSRRQNRPWLNRVLELVAVGVILWIVWARVRARKAGMRPAQTPDDVMQVLREAAERGEAEAQVALAACYQMGSGVPQDDELSVSWCRKAAEQGNAEALTMMAIYTMGTGICGPRNDAEGVRLLRAAAEQKHGDAMLLLALCAECGIGMAKDAEEAQRVYRELAERGSEEAQTLLADKLLKVPSKREEAVRWYREAAERGECDAQYMLGECCAHGVGTPRNMDEAHRWWKRSAAQGGSRARLLLRLLDELPAAAAKAPVRASGMCAELGIGREPDAEEALRCYREAAGQGDTEALYRLGECCANGWGCGADTAEALKWYRRAAEQGHPLAQYVLGEAYFSGEGVERCEGEYFRWMRAAVDNELPDVLFNVSSLMKLGLFGWPRDEAAALRMLKHAAALGLGEAQADLSELYESGGLGVEANEAESARLLRSAAEGGVPSAQYKLAIALMLGQASFQMNGEEGEKWLRAAVAQKYGEAVELMQELQSEQSA